MDLRFEKHWKLMASKVNWLVSISSANSKLLYSTGDSLFVLSPLSALYPPLRWMRRHGVLSTSMYSHANVQLHLSASVQMEFPTQTYVSEHSQLLSVTLKEDFSCSIRLLCSTFPATACIHPSSVLEDVAFYVGFIVIVLLLFLFCCWCCLFSLLILISNLLWDKHCSRY